MGGEHELRLHQERVGEFEVGAAGRPGKRREVGISVVSAKRTSRKSSGERGDANS